MNAGDIPLRILYCFLSSFYFYYYYYNKICVCYNSKINKKIIISGETLLSQKAALQKGDVGSE